MDEDRLWAMYHRERAIEDVLQKAFLNVDGAAEQQLAAIVKLQQQHGRVQILEELTTLAYIENNNDEAEES